MLQAQFENIKCDDDGPVVIDKCAMSMWIVDAVNRSNQIISEL